MKETSRDADSMTTHAESPASRTFEERLEPHVQGELRAEDIATLQVNIGKYCNQTCRHCHVDSGPHRLAEQMSDDTARHVVRVLCENTEIRVLDLTGGAPEINRVFRVLVSAARRLKREVIDRSNLTVLLEPGQEDLAAYLAAHQVKVIASLPCYLKENVDRQRGNGVFERSIRAIRLLNAAGYGIAGSGLELDLVYNPVGFSLPPAQDALEVDYKRELTARHGIYFNRLLTITNMPIARYRQDLVNAGKLDMYMELLARNFNAATIPALMCRHLISVSWEGLLFDCDFNQMLGMDIGGPARLHIRDFDDNALRNRLIRTASHCFGCTAGCGSSCSGALTLKTAR
jgi:radical SAM/Cys-rich protein